MWRRPVVALYLWIVGVALHNSVGAALYGAGVRGSALTAILAWKEILLAVALGRLGVLLGSPHERVNLGQNTRHKSIGHLGPLVNRRVLVTT